MTGNAWAEIKLACFAHISSNVHEHMICGAYRACTTVSDTQMVQISVMTYDHVHKLKLALCSSRDIQICVHVHVHVLAHVWAVAMAMPS